MDLSVTGLRGLGFSVHGTERREDVLVSLLDNQWQHNSNEKYPYLHENRALKQTVPGVFLVVAIAVVEENRPVVASNGQLSVPQLLLYAAGMSDESTTVQQSSLIVRPVQTSWAQ